MVEPSCRGTSNNAHSSDRSTKEGTHFILELRELVAENYLWQVHVRRIVLKDTVEERMREIQSRKQKLVDGTLSNNTQQHKEERITVLKMLFR